MRLIALGLARDLIIVESASRSILVEPEAAVAPLYGDFTTPSRLDLARLTNRSLRQLRRDVKTFTEQFDVFGTGFRELARVARLRIAALLLSAPEATIVEVADRVGYASVDALARAFRDGGLPPPGMVRDAVLYPREPRD